MIETRPSCSLYALLAAHSPTAVVYRRGPSKQTCLIRWDRSDDSFEIGQWFKGGVYPERSALAPNGEHLLTFMGMFRAPYGTWTALSKPPYFTALALWPKGDTWGGGGEFITNREFVLKHREDQCMLAPGFVLPPGFTQHAPGLIAEDRLKRARTDDRHAWTASTREGARGIFRREGENGVALLTYWRSGTRQAPGTRQYELALNGERSVLASVNWADFDRNGDLLFSISGRLYRCPPNRLPEPETAERIVENAIMLADFTSLTFRELPAPYAAPTLMDEDGAPLAYAPPLDRVSKEDRKKRETIRRLKKKRAKAIAPR